MATATSRTPKTVHLNHDVWLAMKRIALDRNKTLAELIDDVLRRYLDSKLVKEAR